MAGYFGYSMSNNAMDAYNRGLLPLSKIRFSDIKEAGLDISLKFFKWLCKENYITATEWHHTSKHYNITYFYDLQDCKEQLDDLQSDVNRWNGILLEYENKTFICWTLKGNKFYGLNEDHIAKQLCENNERPKIIAYYNNIKGRYKMLPDWLDNINTLIDYYKNR